MTDLKTALLEKLQEARAAMLSTLDGLGEYDVRRPMTPSGTNILGLVKHLIGIEHVYLADSFDRPPPDVLPWVADGSIWDGTDMWVTADQSRGYILGLYQRACEHSDETVAALELDSPGSVPHWPEERRAVTLGFLLIRMIEETGHHAGHADICRELVDGKGGSDQDALDEAGWRAYLAEVQAAADRFRPEAG